MSEASLHGQVAAFFDAFCAAFATFDGSEVAGLYHVPHVAVRGDGSVDCVISDSAVGGFFQNALDGTWRVLTSTEHLSR